MSSPSTYRTCALQLFFSKKCIWLLLLHLVLQRAIFVWKKEIFDFIAFLINKIFVCAACAQQCSMNWCLNSCYRPVICLKVFTYSLTLQIVNDWMVMLTSPECDKLRKDGFHSSQYYSQSPAFSATSLCENVHLDEEKTEKKKKVNLSTNLNTVLPFTLACMLLLEKQLYLFGYAICHAIYNQFHHFITKILSVKMAFIYVVQQLMNCYTVL